MPCLQTACDMAQGASIIIVVSTILVFLPLALLREGLERSIRQHWSGACSPVHLQVARGPTAQDCYYH